MQLDMRHYKGLGDTAPPLATAGSANVGASLVQAAEVAGTAAWVTATPIVILGGLAVLMLVTKS